VAPTTSGEGSDSASDSQTGEATETVGESATDGHHRHCAGPTVDCIDDCEWTEHDVTPWRVRKGVKAEIGGRSDEVLPPLGSKEVSVASQAFSPTSLLATTGHVWRWDGVEAVDLQSPQHAYGLWATAVDFAYVAGRNVGLGGRWDGQAWKVVNPALDGYLHMFTGSSAQRIFAVGEQKADGSGAIVAFDGIGWSPAAVPAEAEALFAAWTAPTGEVFAVGKAGTIVIGK
jgi:hypothetical protein